jgi:hypothetical protein
MLGVVHEVLHRRRPVGRDTRHGAVENAAVNAVRIVVRLEQERQHRGDQHGCLDRPWAVSCQVAGHFTGAHSESGQHRSAQVKSAEQDMKIGGERVEVITGARPARGTEASPVVGDHPVPGGEQGRLLLFPRVPVQRVAVDQHDGRTGPVILVVDPDGG